MGDASHRRNCRPKRDIYRRIHIHPCGAGFCIVGADLLHLKGGGELFGAMEYDTSGLSISDYGVP